MLKISKNHKDTESIAMDFVSKIKPQKDGATVVGLYGDLGVGKTTFTQILAKNLGIKRKVNSPTFVIMKKYSVKNSEFKYFFHMDAYRLKNEKELIHLGWDEIMGDREHIVFIEWPENIIKSIPKKHHKIQIFHTVDGHRKFKIKNI